MAGLQRASSFAVKKEVEPGDYLGPSSGTDFLALRPGNETSYEPEKLDNDELLNDIGASKSATGKEVVSGSHSAYLRHSGVEGVEPQLGLLYESIFGSKHITTTERDTIVGSTISQLKVAVGEGVEFPQGKAVLIKDPSGFKIRNVNNVSGDDLNLNFNLDTPPAAGINLGKAITYIPVAQGHPTFSTTKYLGGGFAKEATAGNTTTEAGFTMDANGYGEVSFSYEGTRYYFNMIIVGPTNKYIDFTDDSGNLSIALAEKIYKTPIELADAIQAALEAVSAETFTVTFSNVTGKFTISSGSTVFSLLWDTGANAANSIGITLGFDVSADSTGAQTYTSADEQVYNAPYSPVYDTGDAIIIKGAELFVGNATDNICICAQSVAINVSKTVEDEDCICEESGVASKIPVGRTAEMTVTATLKKHDATLLDALLKNAGLQAMMNAGPKSGGNWIPGKCVNFYLQNATVSAYKTGGDSFITAEFTLTGFVTSTGKDLYLNFV